MDRIGMAMKPGAFVMPQKHMTGREPDIALPTIYLQMMFHDLP